MTSPQLNVVIVGMGSFGTLMNQKYAENPQAKVVGTVDVEDFEKATTFKEKDVVFDICVPAHALMGVIRSLAEKGEKKMILPKPLPLNRAEYVELAQIIEKNNMKVAICSQWYYSSVVENLRQKLIMNKGKVKHIRLEFNQGFEAKRLVHLNSMNTFLPHMIQILISMGVSLHDYSYQIIQSSPQKLIIKGNPTKKENPTIELVTAIDSTERVRLVTFSDAEQRPLFAADLNLSDDMLSTMINHHIAFFSDPKGDNETLTFQRYDGIHRELLRIQEQVNNA